MSLAKIHFLNVGHGDCTIIEHGSGNITMLDINNGGELDMESAAEIVEELGFSPQSLITSMDRTMETPMQILRENGFVREGYVKELTNPVKFFKDKYSGLPIFRYIQTHPDLDHMRGLVALNKEGIGIVNFWDTLHDKELTEFRFESDKAEWERYQELRLGGDHKVLNLYQEHTGHYYNDHPENYTDGDGIYILAPTVELASEANKNKKWNNHSYVVMVKIGGFKMILGGDAEEEVWSAIFDKYGDELSCDVLKASHHGRDSGYHQEAVKSMSPTYTIVSVGKKPETDASNKYKQYSKNVLSTRWKGDITVEVFENERYLVTPK